MTGKVLGFIIGMHIWSFVMVSAASGSPTEPESYTPLGTGRQWALGLGAGYAGSGLMFGGSFDYGITENIRVGLSAFTFPSSIEEGELRSTPIQLSVQRRFPVSQQFVPYIEAGVGYYFNNFSLDSEIVDSWDALGYNIKEDVENSEGFHFGAGADFFWTENMAINAAVEYCLLNPHGSWSMTDQVSGTEASGDIGDLNFNTIMFRVGLKYFF